MERQDTREWKEGYRKAVKHLRFVFELYVRSRQTSRAFLAWLWSAQAVAGSGRRGSAQAGRAGRRENLGEILGEKLSDNL